MRTNRIINMVLFALFLVAAFTTIATYGISLPQAPFKPVALNGPTTVETDGEVTALADSESRRLLLLNKDDRLVSMIEYDSISAPIEAITNVCVSGDRVYVAGIKYQSDNDYITQERVLVYDAHGAYKGIAYEVGKPLGYTSTIVSLNAAPKGLTLGVLEPVGASNVLHFYRVDGTGTSELATMDDNGMVAYDGGYSIAADSYAISTEFGTLMGSSDVLNGTHLGDHVFSAVDIGDDGCAYAYDETSEALCRVTPKGKVTTLLEVSGITQVSLNGDYLAFCSRSDSRAGLSSDLGAHVRRLESVTPTGTLSGLFLLIVAARACVVILLLVAVVSRVLAIVRTGETRGLGGYLASTAVVLAVGIAVGYTSYNTYQELLNTRLNTIDAFAEYFGLISSSLAEDVERCADRNIFRVSDPEAQGTDVSDEVAESYSKILWSVGSLAMAANDNGIGTYVRIYAIDESGIFHLYDSMQEHIFGAALNSPYEDEIVRAFANEGPASDDLYEGSARKDTTQFRLVSLCDTTGSVRMVVEVGSRMKSFKASVLSTLTERLTSLLVIIAVVYLCYAELRGCGRSLLSYRAYIGKDNRDALALLTRPFTFSVTTLMSVDGVMTVLIARQLLRDMDTDFAGMLVAIPSVMLGVGLALGYVLYGFVGQKASPRRIGTRGAFAVILFSGLAVCAIVRESFLLYCLAKLLLAIPLATLYSFGYSLPRRADSEEVRGVSAEGVTRTDTSAAAIGTVAGGYAAQMLGSLWVYVLIALGGVLLLAFAQYVFPKHMSPIERKHVRSVKQTFDFLGSPSILQLIGFIMFPMVLAGGYDSFMFPLFSSDMGMSTAAIHNISAFGKLIVYVMIGQIGRTSDEFDKWAVAPASVAIVGLIFLVFSFNSTITWAVVVIALVAVFSKSSDGWKALWLRSAKSRSFPRGRTVGLMFATRSMLLVVQPLILSLLLSAGERVAIISLGIVCVLCAAAFLLASQDTELKPEGWEPPEPPVLFEEA